MVKLTEEKNNFNVVFWILFQKTGDAIYSWLFSHYS